MSLAQKWHKRRGLPTTVAMMCAGWDGCGTATPGFPKDGKWNKGLEELLPKP